MGEPGDLLLIFADALVRSWKQITKFKASGAPAAASASQSAAAPSPPSSTAARRPAASAGVNGELGAPPAFEAVPAFNLEGLIRDERGIRMAPESDD